VSPFRCAYNVGMIGVNHSEKNKSNKDFFFLRPYDMIIILNRTCLEDHTINHFWSSNSLV